MPELEHPAELNFCYGAAEKIQNRPAFQAKVDSIFEQRRVSSGLEAVFVPPIREGPPDLLVHKQMRRQIDGMTRQPFDFPSPGPRY